ncbi:MAG: homoserine kinase [Betaproteobacteria bacterium]|nr:homoserine kinase [Betaproteobacteria bacterium]
MSVFTAISDSTMQAWLADYAVGKLENLQGIEAGVQNSNFFVTTSLGRYVLTLFESVARADLPFYLNLMAHLARHGLPVPAPVSNRSNEYLGTLAGKPAVLVTRLSGHSDTAPSSEHCARVGVMLAALHLGGLSYKRKQSNPRGAHWREQTATRVLPYLSNDDRALLEDELTLQRQIDRAALPQGVIHADLFRDNVLWDGAHIGGVIDFYFACNDALLLDVAITVNDWCTWPNGTLDTARAQALLESYHTNRPFTPAEADAWPAILRRAALRFWLSRLEDFHLPRAGELVTVKNPAEYRDILQLHATQARAAKAFPI